MPYIRAAQSVVTRLVGEGIGCAVSTGATAAAAAAAATSWCSTPPLDRLLHYRTIKTHGFTHGGGCKNEEHNTNVGGGSCEAQEALSQGLHPAAVLLLRSPFLHPTKGETVRSDCSAGCCPGDGRAQGGSSSSSSRGCSR